MPRNSPSSGSSSEQPPGRRTDRLLRSLVNALVRLTRDPATLVDRTPYHVVHRNHGKLVVRRYGAASPNLPGGRARHRIPVLLIPPLMVKPFIYDLAPQRSFVEQLLAAGFDVFLVDFGEPEAADESVDLDSYVLDWLPQAVDAVCRSSGVEQLSLVGYCMGGLFSLMHTSANRDQRVRNLVTIGSPVDSRRMGLLSWAARVAHHPVIFVSQLLGNVPGSISSAVFKMIHPLRGITRRADLLLHLWNDEYVDSFDALELWTRDFIDYPGDAFRQFFHCFFQENQLRRGEMTFGEQQTVADLSWIRCPVLVFAGRSDVIAPVPAAARLLDLVSSSDKELRVVAGGHLGIVAGSTAPAQVWTETARWLAPRSVDR